MPITHSFFVDTKNKIRELAELNIERIIERLAEDGIVVNLKKSSKRALTADFSTKLPLTEPFTKKETRFAGDITYTIQARNGLSMELTNQTYSNGHDEYIGVLATLTWKKPRKHLKTFLQMEDTFKNIYENSKKKGLAKIIPFPAYVPHEPSTRQYAIR